MKIVSFGPKGQEKPGVIVGDEVIDLTAADPSLPATVRGILAGDRLADVSRLSADAPDGARHPVDSVRLGPPVTDPSKIICLGLNYRDHAEEQDRKAPESPLLFGKALNVLAGDGDAMPYPRLVEQLDYEIELAFII